MGWDSFLGQGIRRFDPKAFMIRPFESVRPSFVYLLDQFLGIRPGEGARTGLLFAYLFCASAVFILGRTVRDTLFLSRYSIAALPWMFVLFGVSSALVAIFYGAVADRFPRRAQIMSALGIGAASYIGVWFLVRGKVHWIYPAFYIWTEVVANLLIMQFWTMANDLHDARAAKRLFGTIGSARICGVIICGLLAGAAVKAIGTAQLILVLAALLAVMAVLVTLVLREPADPGRLRHPAKPKGRKPPIASNPYIRSLAAVILLIFIALTIGDYQFKIVARSVYSEDALARFFSLFYAAAGAAGLLFQVFLTPKILRRLGILVAMLVMPLCFAGFSAGFLLLGGLTIVSFLKFSDNGFQYTIHETALQVLYVPFPEAVKARARALLDTAVKPLSYALGGIALVLLADKLSVRSLSFFTLPVALLWILLLPKVKKYYLLSLEASISGRAGSFAIDQDFVLDAHGRRLLIKALDSPETTLVLHSLDRLKDEDSPMLREALHRLMSSQSHRVRQQALLKIAALGGKEFIEDVRRALSDKHPEVRAAALEAFCSMERDDAIEDVEGYIRNPDGVVRVAATVGLIRYGGIEGAVVGGARLESLLSDENPISRIEAAEVLRQLGPPGYRPLKRLLCDEEVKVRKAALKAASSVADPRLVPILIEALAAEGSRRRAARALAAIGDPAFQHLLGLLVDGGTRRDLKLVVPRILKSMPSEGNFKALMAIAPPPDPQVRLRLYSCLGSMRESMASAPLPLQEIQARISFEIDQAHAISASWEGARKAYETPLLVDDITLEIRRSAHKVFHLLELRYPKAELDLVWRHIKNAGQSATAIEILDTLVEAQIKDAVISFTEEVFFGSKQKGGPAPKALAPLEFLLERCSCGNPFSAFAALCAAAQYGEKAALPSAISALSRPEPIAREGALLAACVLAGGEERRKLTEPLKSDHDPVVSSLATQLCDAPEATMYSTVEKVLFLMSVPIFAKLPGEDLAPLARIAETEVCQSGATIFKEGEIGDALFVVMRGKVAIQKKGVKIAELGPKECFGEMSVLDATKRSADAVAAEDTEILKIDSEAFYEILHEQVEIAEGVIKVLTQRLRESEERHLHEKAP